MALIVNEPTLVLDFKDSTEILTELTVINRVPKTPVIINEYNSSFIAPVISSDKLPGKYGTSGYLDLIDISSSFDTGFKLLANSAVMVNFSLSKATNKSQWLFSIFKEIGLDRKLIVEVDTNNKIKLWIDNINTAFSTSIIEPLKTYNIILYYDGTSLKLYINGILETSIPYTSNNETVVLGCGMKSPEVTSDKDTGVRILDFNITNISDFNSFIKDILKSYTRNVLSFQSTFSNNTKVTSNVPMLWETNQTSKGLNCYSGTDNAVNFKVVPLGWGGAVTVTTSKLNMSTLREGVFYLPTLPTLIVTP